MNGKGDTYRPTNWKAWDENYDRIFGPKHANDQTPNHADEQAYVAAPVFCRDCGCRLPVGRGRYCPACL